MYAADYDDRLPLHDWMTATEHYTQNWDVFRCPSLPGGRSGFGYALNRSAAGRKLAELAPNTPLIFDSRLTSINAVSGLETLPSPARHAGFNNVLSVDGGLRKNDGRGAESDRLRS